MRRLVLSFAAALLVSGIATPTAARRSPPTVPGMVSAADPRGAEAGAEMLRQGGSAIDAAIATMLAMNVVEPQSSGIGGGGYLLYAAAGGSLQTYDGREEAPVAATGTWFYKDGKAMRWPEARPGGKSVGVPGNLRMLALAHKQHGKLPWAILFQPAIRLAREGFKVTPRLYNALKSEPEIAGLSAEGRALFYRNGQPVPVGSTIRNPALANFLQRISKTGPDAFYSGENAHAIATTVNASPVNPSQMTVADLAAYEAKPRPPVCGTYRGYRICGMGPSSSGGTTVFAILKQLERFDLSALGPRSPVAWHLIADSERLAYADREKYQGDSDFVPVPVAGLVDANYLASRSARISPDAALAAVSAGVPPGAPNLCAQQLQPERGTTHFVAVDRWGDVASETSTVESGFGSGLMVNGYFLNNELTDFSFEPTVNGCPVPNAVAGGKRPRSAMSPTIVWGRDGHIRIAVGAAGGPTIPAQVAKVLIGVIDWHLSAQEAVALPMIYAPGDTVYLESGTWLAGLAPQLQALGHTVGYKPPGTFKANAIEWAGGRWSGAADPRSEGAVASE